MKRVFAILAFGFLAWSASASQSASLSVSFTGNSTGSPLVLYKCTNSAGGDLTSYISTVGSLSGSSGVWTLSDVGGPNGTTVFVVVRNSTSTCFLTGTVPFPATVGSANTFNSDVMDFTACTNADTCTTNVSFSLHNNTFANQSYLPYNIANGTVYPTALNLTVGTSGILTVTVACNDSGNISVMNVGNSSIGQPTTYLTNQAVAATFGSSSGGTAGTETTGTESSGLGQSVSQPSPVTYNPTNNGAISNASPIVFTQGTNNGTLATEQGDAAIVTAISQFAAQNHSDNSVIQGQLGAGTNELQQLIYSNGVLIADTVTGFSNVVRGLTNGVGGATNVLTLTNYNLQTTQEGISNLLFAISTNMPGTNLSGAPLDNGSNYVSALAQTTAALTTQSGYIDAALAAITGADSIGGDPGHSGAWNISFMGTTWDFDPVDHYPEVCTFSTGVWAFLLVVAYLFDVGRIYIKIVQIWAGLETGGVPDINSGVNLMGMIFAVILPAILLGAYVILVTVVITDFSAFFGYLTAIGSVFTAMASSTAGAMGLHILFSCFPVALCLHLCLARLTLYLTMPKAAMLAVGASKFLWGK